MATAGITSQDLKTQFVQLINAAVSVGIDANNWRLVTGSKLRGNAFRIVERDPESGGHSTTVLGDSFLGWTKGEAFDALSYLQRGLQAQTNEYRRKTS